VCRLSKVRERIAALPAPDWVRLTQQSKI
jgi:hypothetical protein